MIQLDHHKLCGWRGPDEAAKGLQRLKRSAAFVPFLTQPIAGMPTTGVRVVLWDAAKKVLGRHIKTFKQEIGDCTSFGAANAIDYLTVVEISTGANWEYHDAFQPFIYGCARVLVEGQHSYSDGSTGSATAEAVHKYGALFYDDPGVPSYSGDVAKKWGYSGPPQEDLTLGATRLVRSVTQVSSFDQCVQSVGSGYAVTVASNVGFEGDGDMQGQISTGKCWGVRGGSWGHQMCIIGVDSTDSRPGAFIINSWGPTLWPNQPDGAPPGGFWADAKFVDQMLGQGDSFAYSQFDGFPAKPPDWSIV